MGTTTEIAWTDSTFNAWWGCAKISPGCDNCYAKDLDERMAGPGGKTHWGVGAPHRTLSNDNWKKPYEWHKQAALEGRRHRVFCGSMMDWADKRGPIHQRDRLWGVIRTTPFHDWLMLTKRVPNIKHFLPDDWGPGWLNVVMGCTVEDKKYGLKRMRQLIEDVPAQRKFLSIEPLLEDLGDVDFTGIDWIIVGGESGADARAMDIAWARRIRDQAAEQGISFFFKQMGARSPNGLAKGLKTLDGVKHYNFAPDLEGQPHRFDPMDIEQYNGFMKSLLANPRQAALV
jgi:protein gp37